MKSFLAYSQWECITLIRLIGIHVMCVHNDTFPASKINSAVCSCVSDHSQNSGVSLGISPQIMLVLGGSSIEGEIFLLSTMKIPCRVGRRKQRSEYCHLLEMYLKKCGNFEVLSCVCVLRVRENLDQRCRSAWDPPKFWRLRAREVFIQIDQTKSNLKHLNESARGDS